VAALAVSSSSSVAFTPNSQAPCMSRTAASSRVENVDAECPVAFAGLVPTLRLLAPVDV
jgi:hypothetical protein